VLSRQVRPSANRAAVALRLAASCLHHSQSAVGAFFRRLKARVGTPKRRGHGHKLARLVYRLLKYGEAYGAQGIAEYEQTYRERVVQSLARKAKALGYKLLPTNRRRPAGELGMRSLYVSSSLGDSGHKRPVESPTNRPDTSAPFFVTQPIANACAVRYSRNSIKLRLSRKQSEAKPHLQPGHRIQIEYDKKTETRTHLDWQRTPAQARAAYSAGRSREVLPRSSSCHRPRPFRQSSHLWRQSPRLKALEQEFTGKNQVYLYRSAVQYEECCIENYDDNLEHSQWLSLMRGRLELLWKFSMY